MRIVYLPIDCRCGVAFKIWNTIILSRRQNWIWKGDIWFAKIHFDFLNFVGIYIFTVSICTNTISIDECLMMSKFAPSTHENFRAFHVVVKRVFDFVKMQIWFIWWTWLSAIFLFSYFILWSITMHFHPRRFHRMETETPERFILYFDGGNKVQQSWYQRTVNIVCVVSDHEESHKHRCSGCEHEPLFRHWCCCKLQNCKIQN